MSDVPSEVIDWCARFAMTLGIAAPTADEIDALLELAGTAAHASQRQSAPVACWLAARAGVTPQQARDAAVGM